MTAIQEINLPKYSSAEALIKDTSQNPMDIHLLEIKKMIDALNKKLPETGYHFLIGTAQSHGNWQEIIDSSGPIVKSAIENMPPSVQCGEDPKIQLYQIRSIQEDSYEWVTGRLSLLLSLFVVRHDLEDTCFLLPNDPDSQQNWQLFQKMHQNYFPSQTDSQSPQ